MKRLILFTFIFAIIGLSGCSNKNIKKYNYYFEGETEEWKASMPYYAKEEFYTDKYGTYALTLYDVAGDYPLLNKEDVIQVIINLDGEIQTIELSDD